MPPTSSKLATLHWYGSTQCSGTTFCLLSLLHDGTKLKIEQVSQLWQRDHTKLDTFSINVQRYSQNHAQNWIYGPPYGLCIRLFDWTWILFTKTINSLFEPKFGGVRGNVRTSSIARWKVRGRLPVRYNWIFFASSYGWDVTSRYWLKSAFFKGGGH